MPDRNSRNKNEFNMQNLWAILALILTLMGIVVAYQAIVATQTQPTPAQPTQPINPTSAPIASPTVLTALPTTGLQTTVSVNSQQPWQSTNFQVKASETVRIEVVEGSWTTWEGTRPFTSGEGSFNSICATSEPIEECGEPIPDAPDDALIGRVGVGGDLFLVGRGDIITFSESGTLFLSMNDFEDNAGSLTVLIERLP